MTRPLTHRYADPLDTIWLSAAARVGLEVYRTPDAFATYDGKGRLGIGTDETLDPDDCLAQMIFHELCHALVQGPDGWSEPDWGLSNEDDVHLAREWACLRVQAFLLSRYGLREALAPTTDHRRFYDALPSDPLEGPEDEVTLARLALQRVTRAPYEHHLMDALAATAAVIFATAPFATAASVQAAAAEAPAAASSAAASLAEGDLLEPLLAQVHTPRASHPLVGFMHPDDTRACADCAFAVPDEERPSKRGCTRADGAIIAEGQGACDAFESALDCQRCGACCGEAYHTVQVAEDDALVVQRADFEARFDVLATALIKRDDGYYLDRPGGPCPMLCSGRDGDGALHSCGIYDDRPTSCRDFEKGDEHCLTARRRLGLSI